MDPVKKSGRFNDPVEEYWALFRLVGDFLDFFGFFGKECIEVCEDLLIH